MRATRGVAQSGSALGWGPSGRRFKSCRPDHFSHKNQLVMIGLLIFSVGGLPTI